MIAADDPRLELRGACAVAVIDDADGRRLRLGRPITAPATGYHWDNPGATLRFASAARRLMVRLRYSGRHVSSTARNGVGLIRVDGAWRPEWTFAHPATSVRREPAWVEVALPAPGDGAVHVYELVLPYGDSVEPAGVEADAAIIAPPPRRRPRWAAYGDSVTQGFDASHIGATYAWQVAERRGWELLNLGIGGRCCAPEDANAIAACAPDLVTIAIGVNDWQCGVPPPLFGERLADLRRRLAGLLPSARIAVVAPLWVPPAWVPAQATHTLAAYRAAAGPDAIDGAALIDHDPALFDRIAVHPNDAGSAQMAGRLAGRLPW